MLGSATEAEDLVQDVWLRWQTYDRAAVADPAAFLATTITRLAINVLQSARVRRESYVGPWLPEPVDTGADPYLGAERGEALNLAVLMLLERLSPTERAAYVLREAFDYPYPQIAEILQAGSRGPAAGQQGPQAPAVRAAGAGDRRRAAQAADRLRRRRPRRRPGRPGGDPRRGRGQLLRRRRRRPRVPFPGGGRGPCRQVRPGVREPLLGRGRRGVGHRERPVRRPAPARRPDVHRPHRRRHGPGHRPGAVDDEPRQDHRRVNRGLTARRDLAADRAGALTPARSHRRRRTRHR
ncbi:sigma factor-like helix-turn-helix DNA-binding protein [Actinomadura luteofluorescens]|uniref:sigma factor-like helix-turn-helix DNA-binding protein n=1 Tax=Actinomadura luteofluorescens TaxID=46163 RepID=UPI003629B252